MRIKDILNRLDTEKRQKLGEVIRFAIVGSLATLLQYGLYLLLVSKTNHTVAMSIGYVISFVFNFFASAWFTFRVKANANKGMGFVFCHVVNYLLQMATLNFFIWIGISDKLAPIPMFCICVPVNFILVRFFLKR